MNEQETTGKAVLSLIFGILGIVGAMPILGPLVAIACGVGEDSGVGKAGLALGGITLFLYAVLTTLVVGGLLALFFLVCL